ELKKTGKCDKRENERKKEKTRENKRFCETDFQFVKTISSQPRYDHFDNSPNILSSHQLTGDTGKSRELMERTKENRQMR
ncbi:MAG: hypothetical protein IJ449_05445, partial [Clostridia bacterium]|nr:hypothetical protein [Clostridia bacterium]